MPFSTLARAVAQGAQPSDLLLELHREVLAVTGGTASVILQRAGASREYAATSGHGVEPLAGTWLTAVEAAALVRGTSGGPAMTPLDRFPTLHGRLAAASALIAPLEGPGAPAFLIVADPDVAASDAIEVAAHARVEFALALELVRLARQAALHRRIQELLLAFSRGISATLNVREALETLAHETNTLFGTHRVSVWLHVRRARELVLSATSDRAHEPARIPTDSDAAPARGMRLERPQFEESDNGRILVTPLRGWRRALGSIVIEGEAAELDDQQVTDAAYELGRQLSGAIENVQLLEEVLQQRRLLEDTFNSLIDLVIVTDNAMRLVQTNEAFAERVGTPRAGLLERPLADLVGAEMAQWAAAPELAPRKGRARGAETATAVRTRQFTDERLDGTFAATVTLLINQDGAPIGRVLVARDITAQMQLETERQRLQQRLAQSEKLASLGQFVAGIAHEMNNPLQGVLGHLELLIETSEAARPVRPTLRRIYQEGDRAAKIVRNLLVFTGSQRMNRNQIRVERVLARALASRNAALRRSRIEVTRQQAPAVPAISGDALLLQQALLNILINAEHAIADTGDPGRIDISLDTANDGATVVLTIADSGPGIPADVLPRIFDPFFTTKDVGRGTGLGLAITYGIIQEHGGTIEAANRPAGGARFTLEFPAVGAAAAKPPRKPARRRARPRA